MDIKFFIPNGLKIPTTLCLIMDGEYIYYRRLHDAFGYDFEFCTDQSDESAIEKAKKIAEIMSSQSYDHGSEWRITSVEIVPQEDRYKIAPIVRVMFRIKDTY